MTLDDNENANGVSNYRMPFNPAPLMPVASELFGAPRLTKREHFAALAMQGLLAAGTWDTVPSRAIEMADRVLARLEKKYALAFYLAPAILYSLPQ